MASRLTSKSCVMFWAVVIAIGFVGMMGVLMHDLRWVHGLAFSDVGLDRRLFGQALHSRLPPLIQMGPQHGPTAPMAWNMPPRPMIDVRPISLEDGFQLLNEKKDETSMDFKTLTSNSDELREFLIQRETSNTQSRRFDMKGATTRFGHLIFVLVTLLSLMVLSRIVQEIHRHAMSRQTDDADMHAEQEVQIREIENTMSVDRASSQTVKASLNSAFVGRQVLQSFKLGGRPLNRVSNIYMAHHVRKKATKKHNANRLRKIRSSGFNCKPSSCPAIPSTPWMTPLVRPPRSSSVSMGWSDPDWKWGYGVGEAHNAAAKIRRELNNKEARKDFLVSVFAGTADPEEAKLALALKCQRARNMRYDANNWEGLMDDMAACRFEGDDGPKLLCDAIRSRLDEPPNEPAALDPFPILMAAAFTKLDFVEKGL